MELRGGSAASFCKTLHVKWELYEFPTNFAQNFPSTANTVPKGEYNKNQLNI